MLFLRRRRLLNTALSASVLLAASYPGIIETCRLSIRPYSGVVVPKLLRKRPGGKSLLWGTIGRRLGNIDELCCGVALDVVLLRVLRVRGCSEGAWVVSPV